MKQIMKSQIRFLYQRYVQILRLKMKDAIFHDVSALLEQYGVYPDSDRNYLAFDQQMAEMLKIRWLEAASE